MYINDVHILIYVSAIFISMITGDLAGYTYKRYITSKKEPYIKGLLKHTPSYFFILVTAVLYVLLIYTQGIRTTISANLDLIKFIVLIPLLEVAFMVDIKKQIIPNRINLLIFETGLIFTFLYGLSDMTSALDCILGMVAGCVTFLVITLIGRLIYGKEAMGMGDIKMVAALGLYFGLYNILILTLVSFLIGAIISVCLILSRRKSTSEYIAFGPFIVIAAFIIIFIPTTILKVVLMNIFTLGYYSKRGI